MKKIRHFGCLLALCLGLGSCNLVELGFMVGIIAGSSCEQETTYTITFDKSKTYALPGGTALELSTADLIVYEYCDDDKVAKHEIKGVSKGASRKFTANEMTSKVKIQYTLYSPQNESIKESGWLELVYYLEGWAHTDIVFDNDTPTTNVEP